MFKIYQKYLALLYFQNVLVILIALETFYIGIDILTNLKNLPSSANLLLLYVFLNAMSALNYMLPLSLVFAMIVFKFSMIRSNELISMYSIGISKNQLLFPLLAVSSLITLAYILLNTTTFAYSYEYKQNILKYNQISIPSSDLFLKFDGKYVFFKTLDHIKQEAKDIEIYTTLNNNLSEIMIAKKGIFRGNIWELYDVNITKFPNITSGNDVKLQISEIKNIFTLEGFKPKIIENVYHGNIVLSILDSIEAIKFFYPQGINIDKIKASLYTLVFFPMCAPLILMILYYYLPASGRFFNLALMSSAFIFVTLSVWGFLFVLVRFSQSGTIMPELGIILPIFIMFLISLWLFSKNKNR